MSQSNSSSNCSNVEKLYLRKMAENVGFVTLDSACDEFVCGCKGSDGFVDLNNGLLRSKNAGELLRLRKATP